MKCNHYTTNGLGKEVEHGFRKGIELTLAGTEVILKNRETKKRSGHFRILSDHERRLRLGGVNLKKRYIRKKLSALCLAAVAAVMLPAAVLPETVQADDAAVMPETVQADDVVNDLGEAAEENAVYPVLTPLESGEQYEQLSGFLSLSADKFQIYMITFVDAGQNPAQPEGQVQVSLPVPAEYDMSRVAISEIVMDGNTPQRTELSGTAESGNMVFLTDRAGLFVVMEKKVQAELPSSLEMTDKVEKLELTKHESSAAAGTGFGMGASVPRTGDEAAAFLWLGFSAAVSMGLMLLVIAKNMKISKM